MIPGLVRSYGPIGPKVLKSICAPLERNSKNSNN